jgi:hypothetical protein
MGTTTAFLGVGETSCSPAIAKAFCNHRPPNLKRAERQGRKGRSDLTINREDTSIK